MEIDPDGCEKSTTFVIVGGGIGGLAMALALQRNGFHGEIYERDLDFQSRPQGYSLTIQKNGFAALKELGIADKVRQLGADSTIVGTSTYNQFGELVFSKPKNRRNSHHFNNFAVSRQSLRECLMNELDSSTVHWSKEVVRYEATLDDPPGVRIVFSDQTCVEGCALIGCDGVRSSIRRQMLGDELNYLGVWAINGISPHHNNPFLLKRTIQTIDGQSRLFIKPFSTDRCMWQLTFKVSDGDQPSQTDLDGLLKRAKQMTEDWHEPIRQLINDTPITDVRAGPLFDRDPLETLKKDLACVTMLGDAVHPMSPFKGQGANQALVDAVALVRCLVEHKDETNAMEKAFEKFEGEMLHRTRRFILGSRQAVAFLHTGNALSSESTALFLAGKHFSS